jgi:selenocysteine-specific elongation factor
VVLLDREQLVPGQAAFVQLYLGQPVVTTWRQAFVVRQESPAVTIGGGQVLDPQAGKIRRTETARIARLAELDADDPLVRASAALFFAGIRDWRPEELARTAGVDDVAAAERQLLERGDLVQIVLSPSRTVRVHRDVLADLRDRIEALLARLHQQFPLLPGLERSKVVGRFSYLDRDGLVDAVLSSMSRAGRIRLSEREVSLVGHGPQLSNNERKLLESIVELYLHAGCQPPTVEEVKSQTAKNQAVVPELINLAAASGTLVKISPEYWLHAEVDRRLRDVLAERMAGGQALTVSQIREILGTTRKYAVPLCEFLDRTGFTRRQGDLRVLARPANEN